ncbi:mCG147057 [Mus musculus]|jgi:hypothetical protein|nr:mCG147057 [Mus musculus]
MKKKWGGDDKKIQRLGKQLSSKKLARQADEAEHFHWDSLVLPSNPEHSAISACGPLT